LRSASRTLAALLVGGSLLLPASAQVPAWSLQAQQRLVGGPAPNRAAEMAQRARLLEQGEAHLAAGNVDAALTAFDAAAMLLHAADTELALVRTYMQAGEYRRALAFGAHAAGAHRELPGATAVYAWLLHLGGQGVVARYRLDEALAEAPDGAVLRQAREALARPWPRPEGVLMRWPLRLAPRAQPLPASAMGVGSAVLAMDGRSALAPAGAVDAATRLWLRNGMGQTSAAHVVERLEALGLVRLELDTPMPPATGLSLALRAPHAGSPGSLVEFGASDDAAPAWPQLRQGFFARAVAPPAVSRALGIAAPTGPRGGPVFDAAGRFAGVAMPGADGIDRLVPASAVAAALGFEVPVGPAATAAALPLDAVYELALRNTLQLIAEH